MDIRKITEELSVAPQIRADDVAAIAAAGFRAVICNRPDGESSDQPCCEGIEAAVKASGMAWRMQPVRSGGVTQADADAFGALMAELPKPVLAYCRSGTRCATLWCLSEAGKRPLPDILQCARSAGYDMAAVMERAMGATTCAERAMFEIGKSYTIRMWEDGEDGGTLADYDNCEVIEIALPLVKFRQPSNEDVIINTASLTFVQATPETDEEAESEE